MHRDFQRKALYAWEREGPFAGGMYTESMSLEECEALVWKVWVKERGRYGLPKTNAPVVQAASGGRRNAKGSINRVVLPRWARNPWVVLHEVAHGLTMFEPGTRNYVRGGWHGPRFVGCLIGLAARHLAADAERLHESALEAGLKVDSRSIGAVPAYGWPRRVLDQLRQMGGEAPNDVEVAFYLGTNYRTVQGSMLVLTRQGLARYRGRSLVLTA